MMTIRTNKKVNLSGNRIVTRSTIFETNAEVYEAYELTLWNAKALFKSSHSTMQDFDNICHGLIQTARLPDSLDDLHEASDQRVDEARMFRNDQEDKAYAAILEAFPELKHKGRRDFGKIVMEEN